jgi:iron complex transport system substrate-binding protein
VGHGAAGLLRLHPDLAISASFAGGETVAQVRAAGLPVLILHELDSIASIRQNIEVIAFATGADASGARLLADLDRRVAAALARVPEHGSRPRVVSHVYGTVASAGSIFHDVVSRLGAVNVPADEAHLPAWPRVGLEQVAAWNPDFLFTSSEPGREDAVRAELLAHGAIAASRAGRQGHIVVLPAGVMTTVSHHVALLVEQVAAALYGDAGRSAP